MNTWTLLTAPGWVDKCPPMPGRNGPTYAEQIKLVDRWMAPATRTLYLKATKFECLVAGDMCERNPRP
jgi:hypothetical protein